MEIGCGVGRLLKNLPITWKRIGLDHAPNMVKEATSYVQDAAIELGVTSDYKIAYPDNFVDFLYCFAVLEHVPTLAGVQEMLKEMYRVVKPGGVVRVFSVQGLPHDETSFDQQFGCFFPSLAAFGQEVTAAGFKILEGSVGPGYDNWLWVTGEKVDPSKAVKFSICIPYKTDGGSREKIFQFNLKRLAVMCPEAEICVGEDDLKGEVFNAARARNNAAKRATTDTLLFLDADIIFRSKDAITSLVSNLPEHGLSYPSVIARLTQEESDAIIAGGDNLSPQTVESVNASGVFAVRRAIFEQVNGFNEQWLVYEDSAFRRAVEAFGGVAFPCQVVMYHLWHPPVWVYDGRDEEVIKRRADLTPYYAAVQAKDVEAMKSLTAGNRVAVLVENYSGTLDVAIIAKNEEALLPACLESLKGVDNIIVVDTGSTDGTIEIAKRYTDKVYQFEWCDDFSAARNFAMSQCLSDWILIIDCDERLLTPVVDIKAQLDPAFDALQVWMKAEGGQLHRHARIFKKHLRYALPIHEAVPFISFKDIAAEIFYGYSPTHLVDPDLDFRILKKEVEINPTARMLYYLAREYSYRGEWETAIEYFNKCVQTSAFIGERADAYLYMARGYWQLGQGDKARDCALDAILLNPWFSEAFRWMGEIVWPHQKDRWLAMGKGADNRGVLFIR
jgi:glycosyltransferase involved in cell wall biosynthesis